MGYLKGLVAGGAMLGLLDDIRRDVPLSLHGVGLSLGSAGGIDTAHLQRLKALIDRLAPGLISDHLSWSVAGGVYLPDLLPLPYTEEALEVVAGNVDRVQDVIGRPLLVENPSRYLRFEHSAMTEAEFLARLFDATGAGWLFDAANLHANMKNHALGLTEFLEHAPLERIRYAHVAGGFEQDGLYHDTHAHPVGNGPLGTLEAVLRRTGPLPVLLEKDRNYGTRTELEGELDSIAGVLARSEVTYAA